MPKTILLSDVPDALHRELVRKARSRGLTLPAYLQAVLEREAIRPDGPDVVRRLRLLPSVRLPRPIADILRDERREREGDPST